MKLPLFERSPANPATKNNIPLFAEVDEIYFPTLLRFRWYYGKGKPPRTPFIIHGGTSTTTWIYLHRMVYFLSQLPDLKTYSDQKLYEGVKQMQRITFLDGNNLNCTLENLNCTITPSATKVYAPGGITTTFYSPPVATPSTEPPEDFTENYVLEPEKSVTDLLQTLNAPKDSSNPTTIREGQ